MNMAEEQKKLSESGKMSFAEELDSRFRFEPSADILEKRAKIILEKVDLSPKLDPLLVRAIDNVYKGYGPFYVKNPHPVRPSDHYLEIMRLKGWLDLDLNDPDLAPLFK